jgi:serine/threonine-protein kinase
MLAILSTLGAIPPAGASPSPQTNLPFVGLNHPDGVAAVLAGNVYVTDSANNRVLFLQRTGASYAPQVNLPFGGLNHPDGVAVAFLGNVYVTDSGNNRVLVVRGFF